MTPDEFRRYGRAVVDWIADYYEQIESLPVLSQVEPGRDPGLAAGRAAPAGRAFRGHSQGRRGADPARHHPLAVAQFLRLLSGQRFRPGHPGRPALVRPGRAGHAVGHQPGLHRAGNPRAGLAGGHAGSAGASSSRSTAGGGVIQDTASSASLCALLAARERATGFASNEHGCRRAVWWPTPPPRPTRRSKKRSRSPGWAARTCA